MPHFMGHFHLQINTSEVQPMRLFEFADAESQMELWKLITDNVWQAICKQAQEQKQLDAQKAKSMSAASKQAKPFKPKIVSPQPSKTKKTSAQEIQRQKVQSNAVKSVPKTTSVPSSSATASVGKNQSNPLTINQTAKMLDTFSNSKAVKDLTK
jgi:crotonobetainyl-CoA:carnitine CoA-transferase CaiB-like acyl-CoA transferase